MTRISLMALALAASATLASAAEVTWIYDGTSSASNKWGNNPSWSAAPAWDGTDDIVLQGITANRTLTLDGDRTINSLKAITGNTATANRNFSLSPGTPNTSALTILSGNITIDGSAYESTNNAVPLVLTNTPIIIGDGATPRSAQWMLRQMYKTGANLGRAQLTLGEVRGMAGTVVTVKTEHDASGGSVGNNGDALQFNRSSNNFLGTFVLDSAYRMSVTSAANNGLGAGSFEVKTETIFNFTTQTQTEDADIVINHATGTSSFAPDSTSFGMAPRGTVTLTGDLSGIGNIAIGTRTGQSTTFYNTVVHDGNSTLSGNVAIAGGTLRVNGTWSGTGDVLAYAQYSGTVANLPDGGRYAIEGTGTLGLASGKSITLKGNVHQAGSVGLFAPGTDGTVGTLTVGTDNTNNIIFDDYSRLAIDIDGANADKLVINGNLDLSKALDQLVLNVLSAPTLGLYTLVSYTGTLTGTFDGVSPLPSGYLLSYDTPGQINLVDPSAVAAVPEPVALALLPLAAMGLLGRRRRA